MGKNQYLYPPEYRARMVELVRAGDGSETGQIWSAAALRALARSMGSQPTRPRRPLPGASPGRRHQHRGGGPQPGRGSDGGDVRINARRHRAR